jgi:hypothetical protein
MPQQVKEFINDDRKVAEIGQLSRILKTKQTMQEISEEEQKGIADADAVVEKTKMDNLIMRNLSKMLK